MAKDETSDELFFDDVFAHGSEEEERRSVSSWVTIGRGTEAEEEEVVYEEDEQGDFSVSFQETGEHMREKERESERQRVGQDDFEVLRLVGKGAYGKVHQVRKRGSQEVLAMKVLRKEFLVKTNNVSYTMTERNILRNIHHPFIASLHYAFQTQGKVYLVMDFLPGGQLLWHMRQQAMLTEDAVRVYAAELVLALEYLHSRHIVHRDIKPENVLLQADGHLCLTDFGLAKVDVEDESTKTFCGTVEYMAPEIIKGDGHGKAVDWWSLGVLVFDMLAGETPFRGKHKSKLQDQIIKGKFKMPPYFTSASHALIKGLLNTDPKKRLGSNGVDEIKKHRFFKGIRWDAVREKRVSAPFDLKLDDHLDLSYFDKKYTKVKPGDSPTDDLSISRSQEKRFQGFSYVRSFDDHLGHIDGEQ